MSAAVPGSHIMHPRLNRRELLMRGSAALLHLARARPALARNHQTPPQFGIPLPIPPFLRPVRQDATTDYYEITQSVGSAEIAPGMRTGIWGYEATRPNRCGTGVACANLTTLLLARISTRRRELAVRAALGARGSSLLTSIVAESLIIAVAGGLAGLLIATAAVRAVRLLDPANLPRLTEIESRWTVLFFAMLVMGLTALLFGALAAWHGRRLGIRESLKDVERGHTQGTAVRRVRHALVIAQLALSVVLLIGAGLLGRSLASLLSQNVGFRREGVLAITLSNLSPVVRITDGEVEFADPASLPRQAQLNERLLERLRALPGVVEAGGVDVLPMAGREGSSGAFLIVRTDDQAQRVKTLRDLMPFFSDTTRTGNATFRVASAGYFRAMRIPLVRGRLFDERDSADAPHGSPGTGNWDWPDARG